MLRITYTLLNGTVKTTLNRAELSYFLHLPNLTNKQLRQLKAELKIATPNNEVTAINLHIDGAITIHPSLNFNYEIISPQFKAQFFPQIS